MGRILEFQRITNIPLVAYVQTLRKNDTEDPNTMETVHDYHHTEAWEGFWNSKELPISLLWHTYKLYEKMILNIIAPTIEQHLIKEQVGFRPGKSCTTKLLNLTQHIEDGYQESIITAFVDLSDAYDTVNNRLLIQKLFNIMQDSALCRVIQNLLSNRRLYSTEEWPATSACSRPNSVQDIHQ